MLLVLICHDSKYTRVLNVPGLHKIPNMPEEFFDMPGYARLYLDMSQHV